MNDKHGDLYNETRSADGILDLKGVMLKIVSMMQDLEKGISKNKTDLEWAGAGINEGRINDLDQEIYNIKRKLHEIEKT